jgi:hypothetical protein
LSAGAGTPNKGGTEFLPPKCMEKQIKLHFLQFLLTAQIIYDTLFSILKDESCLQEFFKAIYLRTAQQGRAGILTFEMPQRRAKSVSC